MKKYRVVFEMDESGHWVVSVPEVPGCHTYGRSIRQARRRIREALALFVPNAARVQFVEEIKLPTALRGLVERQRAARARADKEQQRAQEALSRAIYLLTVRGMSVRDAGELLGLSYQRVQQLREAAEARA